MRWCCVLWCFRGDFGVFCTVLVGICCVADGVVLLFVPLFE